MEFHFSGSNAIRARIRPPVLPAIDLAPKFRLDVRWLGNMVMDALGVSAPRRATHSLIEGLLFPRSRLVNLIIVAILSASFALLLTGKQIYAANWGIIDDHDIFSALKERDHFPLSELWSALLARTTEGQVFRPTYYLIRLLEASLFGANVHLWYLANTICFAIFLGSAWWIMLRFIGGWLSGALTASIALLPLWAGVWSRLGPSEIYGAACVGLMLLCTNAVFSSTRPFSRNIAAIGLALATIALAGIKETFFPLAVGTACVFIFAGITRRLSLLLIARWIRCPPFASALRPKFGHTRSQPRSEGQR